MMARKNQNMTLEGMDEVEAALDSLGQRVSGFTLRDAALEAAQVIVEEARRLAPEASGDLMNSIDVEVHKIQAGRVQLNISYGRDQFYGLFFELGTEKMAAKPFLRPAMDAKAEEAVEEFERALRKALSDLL